MGRQFGNRGRTRQICCTLHRTLPRLVCGLRCDRISRQTACKGPCELLQGAFSLIAFRYRVLMEVNKKSITQNSLLGLLAGLCKMCLWRLPGSVSATPVEDRGLRPSGCLLQNSFSTTPVEDRGFGLSGCLPGVASEVHFQ